MGIPHELRFIRLLEAIWGVMEEEEEGVTR